MHGDGAAGNPFKALPTGMDEERSSLKLQKQPLTIPHCVTLDVTRQAA
jgi:hypothetical protein